MTDTLYERLTATPEGLREYQRGWLELNLTEAICDAMTRSGVNAQTLALLTVVFSVLALVMLVVRAFVRGRDANGRPPNPRPEPKPRPTMRKGGQNLDPTTKRPPDAKPLGRLRK